MIGTKPETPHSAFTVKPARPIQSRPDPKNDIEADALKVMGKRPHQNFAECAEFVLHFSIKSLCKSYARGFRKTPFETPQTPQRPEMFLDFLEISQRDYATFCAGFAL